MKKTRIENDLPNSTAVEGADVSQNATAIQIRETRRDPEGLRNEYTQVNEFIRHYATLRFVL